MKKKLSIVLAVVLVLALGVGATIAYLTATTEEVRNTFTMSPGMTLDLKESKYNNETGSLVEEEVTGNAYENLAPGQTVPKDPKVKYTTAVKAYIFMTISDAENLTYAIDSTWGNPLTDNEGHKYYCKAVEPTDTETPINVLNNTSVMVNLMDKDGNPLTKDSTLGTIIVKAAAIQQEGLSVTDAWEEVKGNIAQ